MGKNKRKIDKSSLRTKNKEVAAVNKFNTLLDENTPFSVAEAYKATRTNIMFSLGTSKGCKKIILTSANPGEGKTTSVLNIAIAFAQTDSKVLVIDADLRKPRIYRLLKFAKKGGLSDILCNMIDVDEAIHHNDEYNIDCITSGQIPPNPAELLSSEAMGELLDTLSDRYDYIFIDTPPVTVVTDAAIMAKHVNGVIIVARQNYTVYETLTKARENLLFADAKILGYVLNDVAVDKYGYGKYGYKYNYGYGYNNSDAQDKASDDMGLGEEETAPKSQN